MPKPRRHHPGPTPDGVIRRPPVVPRLELPKPPLQAPPIAQVCATWPLKACAIAGGDTEEVLGDVVGKDADAVSSTTTTDDESRAPASSCRVESPTESTLETLYDALDAVLEASHNAGLSAQGLQGGHFAAPWQSYGEVREAWSRFAEFSELGAFHAVARRRGGAGEMAMRPVRFEVILVREVAESFNFGIHRPDAGSVRGVLLVDQILSDGVLDSWNQRMWAENKYFRCVFPFAAILSVNGIASETQAMLQQPAGTRVVLEMANPPTVSAALFAIDSLRGVRSGFAASTLFWERTDAPGAAPAPSATPLRAAPPRGQSAHGATTDAASAEGERSQHSPVPPVAADAPKGPTGDCVTLPIAFNELCGGGRKRYTNFFSHITRG